MLLANARGGSVEDYLGKSTEEEGSQEASRCVICAHYGVVRCHLKCDFKEVLRGCGEGSSIAVQILKQIKRFTVP